MNMKNGFRFLLLAVSLTSLTGQASAQSVSPNITGEFLWGGGLYQIGAHVAYDYGITGKGVTLAVLDTGANYFHNDLYGQFANGGFDFYNNDFDYMDYNGHGTLVAGIIAAKKNDYGIHGVAYNSKILPIKITSDDGNSPSLDAIKWGLYHAVEQRATAINYSSTFAQGDGFKLDNYAVQAGTFFAYTALNGTIVVAPTGNNTRANPIFPALIPYVKPANHNKGVYTFGTDVQTNTSNLDWSFTEGLIVAVASADQNGVISNFSNRCGVAAAWCITAPGEDIISTFWFNTYIDMKGTSLSTAFVTGSIGLLKELFPNLSNAQLVTLLLSTAKKSGIYSNQNVYGQGFLDIANAITPQGNLTLLRSNGTSSSINLLDTSINTSSAFGDSIFSSVSDQSAIVTDAYDRPYTVSLNTVSQQENPDILSLADELSLIETAAGSQPIQITDQLSYTSFAPDTRMSVTDDDGDMPSLNGAIAYTHGSHALHLRSGTATLWDDRPAASVERMKLRLFEPDYLDMSANGQSMGWRYELSQNMHVQIGWRDGKSLSNDDLDASAYTAQWQWADDKGRNISLMLGQVNEQESTLGATFNGAFALAPHSLTQFAGVQTSLPLAQDWTLHGSFYTGQTHAKAASESLVRDVSDLKHQQAVLGLERANIMQDQDRLTIAYEQPLHVTSGKMDVDALSAGTNQQGLAFDLAPQARQQTMHLFYTAPLPEMNGGTFGAHASFTNNNGNVSGENDASILLHMNATF